MVGENMSCSKNNSLEKRIYSQFVRVHAVHVDIHYMYST